MKPAFSDLMGIFLYPRKGLALFVGVLSLIPLLTTGALLFVLRPPAPAPIVHGESRSTLTLLHTQRSHSCVIALECPVGEGPRLGPDASRLLIHPLCRISGSIPPTTLQEYVIHSQALVIGATTSLRPTKAGTPDSKSDTAFPPTASSSSRSPKVEEVIPDPCDLCPCGVPPEELPRACVTCSRHCP